MPMIEAHALSLGLCDVELGERPSYLTGSLTTARPTSS
jgi:hypothetical protein